MMKKIMIIIAVLLLVSLNVFADDVTIDSSGNVKTGQSSGIGGGNLDVTGSSGEHAVRGVTSGTGAVGVYGVNPDVSGYGGYFQGNTRVTGDLTVDGNVIGPSIGDITGVTAGTGLSGGGTSGTVTLDANTTYLQRRVTGACAPGSSISKVYEDGTVVCETDDVGITSESDPKVGGITLNYIPKWNGSTLVTGAIYDNGNVGIGTTAPGSKLHISGGSWDLTNTEGDFKIGDASYRLKIGIANGGGGAGDVRIRSHGGTNRMILGGGTNDVLTVTSSNVGIGTITPSSTLTVAGTIQSTSGGIKFPDGTVQTKACNAAGQQCQQGRFVTGFDQNGNIICSFGIGDTGPAGGIVFYVTDHGLHGLEAAPADQSSGAPWGCLGTLLNGAGGTAVGTGAQNTADIVAGCSESGIAARIANDYSLNGYDDWFLPSAGELDLLYQQRAVVGGFVNVGYWSSLQDGTLYATIKDFSNNYWSFANKDSFFRVRAVRAF